jgi:hypothetical protein
MAKAKKKPGPFCPKCSSGLMRIRGSKNKGCLNCCAVVAPDGTVDVCGNCERCSDKFINTPSQKLADKALENALSGAQTINDDDGEDEDDETYLGEVAMAETAQDLAHWFDRLDLCMRAGFVPKEWQR